jgi:hypothetical protein
VDPINQFDVLPKTIKKSIRYLRQDASVSNLVLIRKLINETIDKRMQNKDSKKGRIF